MKEIDGEMFGTCILCGVVGQGKNDFICLDCGTPDKLMLVCKCGQHSNLTALSGKVLRDYLDAVVALGEKDEDDLRLGMTIFVSLCIFCGGQKALEKETGSDLKIYNIRNQGFNVGRGGENG